jgi:drug/metabolite transporter (DMT)-like permease
VSPEIAAVVFGLGSALVWGGGDFCGGMAARRAPVMRVLPLSQGVGLVLLVLLALLLREPWPTLQALGWGMAAGLTGVVGIGALYAALAQGQAGVVAPVSAVLAATTPVLVAMFTEGAPTTWQMSGFGVALVGIALVSQAGSGGGSLRELGLALLAGVGFGFFFVCIHQASASTVFWPLAMARVTALGLIFGVLIARPGGLGEALPGLLPFALLSGAMDVAGNVLFALAGQAGRLDIAAVLSSLYPASTVLLAWLVLGERLSFMQMIGVLTVLLAIGLIAA